MPPLTGLLLASAFMEAIGGGLLLLGLFIRPVAFLLAGEMAVAYFTAHATHGFFPIENNGEPACLYCFAFLFLFVAGGGAWSVDRALTRLGEKRPGDRYGVDADLG